MAGTDAEVIAFPETLQKELESLLSRYHPLGGRQWLTAELKIQFQSNAELYTVVQRLSQPTRTSPPSESASGREIINHTPVSTDSTSQNHEPQTQTASSLQANTNIFQPEMETENSPEIEMTGEDSMTFTTSPEDDVKSEPLEQDAQINLLVQKETEDVPVSLSKTRSDGDITETEDDEIKDWDSNYEPDSSDGTGKESKDERHKPMINLVISNVRSLRQSAVKSQKPKLRDQRKGDASPSKKRARGDSSESDGDDAESNYEPGSSDETERKVTDIEDDDDDNDSNYEPETAGDKAMINLAVSNVRTLPESAVKTPNVPGICHLDKAKAKNPCKVCGKGFATLGSLRRHMASIHDRRKRGQFKCRECGNSYMEKWTLTRHMRVHRADCPFRCNLCQKPCVSKVDLERHTRAHTGERPFLCPTCNKGYSRKYDLNLHRCAS